MSRIENIPRFYVLLLSPGEIQLLDEEAHHALHVLRLRVGAVVALFDGQGGWAAGEITQAQRRGVAVQVGEVQHVEQPHPRLHVAFAVPKGKRLDWLLEKATELGAASLQPIVFERSVVGGDELTDAKRKRWQGHCLAAAKQSGLNWLPTLDNTQPLAEFLTQPSDALRLVGDVSADGGTLREALPSAPDDIILLVGPEGGFTDTERDAIRDAGYGSVRLGATTLRVETAVVALLAGVRAVLG